MPAKPITAQQQQPAAIFAIRKEHRLEFCPRCWGGGVVSAGTSETGIPERRACPLCEGLCYVIAPRDRRDNAQEILFSSTNRGP